jgi:hypothetical protein
MKPNNKINFLLKSKFVVIVLCLSTLIQVSSCKKYLDKKSNNGLAVPTSLADLQGLLDDASAIMNVALTPSMGEGAADDYFVLQTNYDPRPSLEKQDYIWSPVDYSWPNDWSRSYSPIYNSNYCLEMIENITLTAQNEKDWKNVKGSALFYRAYNFLNLAWNYSKSYDPSSYNTDLGIVLRLGSDFNAPSVRATVKQTYDRVISDSKESIQYLPDVPLHPYRPSRPAAYGLLARAYLSMREYDSALKYSNLCLSLKSDLLDYNNFPTSSSTNPSFSPFNIETIFYTDMNPFGLLTASRAKIDTSLYSNYVSNDKRKSLFFAASGIYQRFKGSYGGGALFTGIATDEMYLIRAECHARRSEIQPAMDDLNALLAKRWKSGTFIALTATNSDDALNKVLMERRKELIFRGLRWMEIKRLNKEGRNILLKRIINGQTYILQPNANYYAIPLPTDIINITGMPQNPYP